jgi:hypothetical protein
MLARMTALSLVVQGILERLILSGQFDLADLDGIKRFALDLRLDLKAHSSSGAQIASEGVEEEVNAFFVAMGYMREGNDNRPR